MNRKQADAAAGILVASILLLGVLTAMQLFLADGGMASQMDSTPVMALFGPVLMSLVVASIVGGIYVLVRGRLFTPDATDPPQAETETEAKAVTDADHPADVAAGAEADDSTDEEAVGSADPPTQRRILDVLRDDERRILEPVIESPGLTQIKVRDRSGFSKSKVSQTITDLEERGLLYREPQGRTYRVYPAEDVDERA